VSARLQTLRQPIDPARIRKIGGQSFAFLPHRFLSDGFLCALKPEELVLYIFLLLAGNRHGVSFWGAEAICAVLHLPLENFIRVRNGLITKNLVAFDGTRFQVLALPLLPNDLQDPAPLRTSEDFEEHDRATIRAILRQSLRPDRDR